MKNLKKVSKCVEIFLRVFSALAIIFLLLLYFICKKIGIHYDLFIFMIYPCGICFIYIVYQFIKLFETIKENNPFNFDNVQRLRNSKLACYLISLLVLIALLFTIFLYDYYSLQLKVALFFISFIFFGVGIALYILSVLFRQATKYKQENDLTI